MNNYTEIYVGKVDIIQRCLRCCKKIKNGKINNKYGKYHKKCYEKEKADINMESLDKYIHERPCTPPKKTKLIYFD